MYSVTYFKKLGKNLPEQNLKGLTSDVTSIVIINIFINNCHLITHFFSIALTDYSYIYFVIKLCNAITC